jgi:nitroreductase
MTVEEAIKGRRSIRKFKTDEIPHEVIRDILDTARWTPSWGNTQPWEFYVLTGQALEEFRKTNYRKMVKGEAFSPDVTIPEIWPDHLKKRYSETGKILLTALGVKREDKEGRNKFYEDMALLFGAPCLIIACIPRNTAVEYAMLDIGLIVQTICLLAYDRGIGSCIMASAIGYPELLRKILSIPDEQLVVMGLALGYPDQDSPLNNFERIRSDITELVTWVD